MVHDFIHKKMHSHRKRISPSRKFSSRMAWIATVLFAMAVFFEIFHEISPLSHHSLVMIEGLAVLVFLFDVAIELGHEPSLSRFLRDKWLDLVILVPYVFPVRIVGMARGFRLAEGATHLASRESRIIERAAAKYWELFDLGKSFSYEAYKRLRF